MDEKELQLDLVLKKQFLVTARYPYIQRIINLTLNSHRGRPVMESKQWHQVNNLIMVRKVDNIQFKLLFSAVCSF